MATDPLDDMPKIRLEKDDLESFHRNRAQASKKTPKTESEKNETTSTSGSVSWFALLFLLFVIIGGASYWSFEQYKVLQQAQARITELESRLSATGEDMDQSAAALQVKVSELSSKTQELWEQMDKLWASAWRRNQSEIAALNKTVMAQKSTTEKSTGRLSESISDNNTAVGLLKERVENQASVLQQLNTSVTQVTSADADLEQQLAALQDKLISTALANNDLTNQIDDLRRRLVATEKKVSTAEQASSAVSPSN